MMIDRRVRSQIVSGKTPASFAVLMAESAEAAERRQELIDDTVIS